MLRRRRLRRRFFFSDSPLPTWRLPAYRYIQKLFSYITQSVSDDLTICCAGHFLYKVFAVALVCWRKASTNLLFYRLVVERLGPISCDRAALGQTLLLATSCGPTVESEQAAICGRADAVGTTLPSAHPRSNAFCKKAVLLVNRALAALRIRASA